jgi:hypothetical protein
VAPVGVGRPRRAIRRGIAGNENLGKLLEGARGAGTIVRHDVRVMPLLGLQAARLALAALPRAFHLPVELAIRAVERVLDLGLGLGR